MEIFSIVKNDQNQVKIDQKWSKIVKNFASQIFQGTSQRLLNDRPNYEIKFVDNSTPMKMKEEEDLMDKPQFMKPLSFIIY